MRCVVRARDRVPRVCRRSRVEQPVPARSEGPDPVGRAAVSLESSGRAQPGEPELPILIYDHDAATAVERALALVARAESLYQRGDEIVEFDSTADSPRLRSLNKNRLRVHLDRLMQWYNAAGKRINPPAEVVAAILDGASRSGLRPVHGVIDAPTLRPDGSLLDAPGYDPATGLILTSAMPRSPIPEEPSSADAREAWARLRDGMFGDFPFASDLDRAVTLAALLTLLGRSTYDGPTPFFVVTANRQAAGKDLLCHTMSTIATGRRIDSSPQPDGDSAMERFITALVRSNGRVVRLDNVTRPLGGAAIEAALTSTKWASRKLGRSELTPSLPLRVTWFATGNHLRTTGDFARRMLSIRLESPHEFPEMRNDFRHPDLLPHVAAHPRFSAGRLPRDPPGVPRRGATRAADQAGKLRGVVGGDRRRRSSRRPKSRPPRNLSSKRRLRKSLSRSRPSWR
ncbi:MAG: hypothetical protein P4L85_05245 [Paludisphaera borealis]|uniref:hypothetical protein n=1 Tax=Paludisphaera borealis TaxID=1387353 RepID=UPI00285218E1|nr:hypothetical protein [Paludisphaera borealis]MDR3618737.1 hypothetical protein [Paludisphaera borealis]